MIRKDNYLLEVESKKITKIWHNKKEYERKLNA